MRGLRPRFWAWVTLVVAAAMAVAPMPAHAQAGFGSNQIALCVAPVQPGERFVDVIAGRVALDCNTRQTDFGSGDFWVSTAPDSLNIPTQGVDLRVRMSSLLQRAMTFGIVYTDGQVVWTHADPRAFARHLQLGAIAEFPIPMRGAAVERIVWRIDGSANLRGVLHGVAVATAAQSADANLYLGALYAAFGGLALALFIYNLALWGALRHSFQLAYCAMVGALLCYTLSTSGAIAWLFDGIDNNFRLRINYATLGLSGAAALCFARRYFEPRVFTGMLGRTVNGVAIALAAISIAIPLLGGRWLAQFDMAYILVFTSGVMLLPLIMWRAHVEGSRYAWMFALAWTAPVLLCAVRVAHAFNLIAWNFWIDNSTLLAMAVEALLSSLAIAYRIRMLSDERDHAVAQGALDRVLAQTDGLTGLLNRRAFLDRAIGQSHPQQLILLDIDHFKLVNDKIGHDGGDEVLRVVSRMLRMAAPDGSLVARLGGEEFAILIDADRAVEPGAILTTLRTTRMPFDLTVTASIGVCFGRIVDESEWKRLYRCADRALFAAKEGGRDRARVADTLAIAA